MLESNYINAACHTDFLQIADRFEAQNGFALRPNLEMLCYVGSHSHGTYDPKPGNLDDTDYMMVVLPPAERLLGLHKWEHWTLQEDRLDVVAYSLEKYVRLVLKSNPNVLGTLYLRPQDYLWRSTSWTTLQLGRHFLASLNAYPAFCGYAHSQLKRLEGGAYRGYMGAERKKLVDQFGYDPKNAAHLIRLWRMGLEYVGSGTLQVYREDREELKSIKRGEWTLEQIREEAARLEVKMQEAKANSPLRPEPDWQWANDYLVSHTAFKVGKYIADQCNFA